jgi:mRNA interferase MazF
VTTPPLRGQLFWLDLGYGPKPWLIVSNNQRNRHLDSVIAARVTTTHRNAHQPTVVALHHDDPLTGWVLVDDLHQLYRDELDRPVGSVTASTMTKVSAALRIALP